MFITVMAVNAIFLTSSKTVFAASNQIHAARLSPASIVHNAKSHTDLRAKILHTADALRGLHYDWGGTSPKTGFDCSGFIQYIFRVHGISLPRTASGQTDIGTAIPKSQLEPGDLLFFTDTYQHNRSNQVTHVALYIGHGDVIESSSVRNQGVVVLHNILNNPWYASRYYGARNVLG
ncbi:C40 family peptidase [Alicyclobacillus dauci]|uniref:C40 family peptidase n=1 Tax=Alicyclobacillus dauci TaxID=1475485 RepID=A0ABY6YY73_9BACL|nr:C40 family peptidase [Alicyclobacillus dauci]WAH35233.1 C40 family peptidase [Alicyclobacillus dauci]